MLAAFKHKGLKDGVVQYGFSLASGLASFMALKLMQHTVPDPALYSQLSTILLSFTTFQIITDFGTQTEFIRSFRTADKSSLSFIKTTLFQSRLLLGLIALFISAIYAASAGFKSEMTLAFILFQLSFIPFAVLTTSDSIFLAREEFSKAILARLARVLAIVAFVVPTIIFHNTSLLWPVLSFTTTLTACSWMTWKGSLQRELKQRIGEFFTLSKSSNSFREVQSNFIRGSLVAASIIALQLIQSLVAQAFLVREIGETSMTHFNTSIAIATPAILAFQTLSQLQMPRVASWIALKTGEVNEHMLRYALKIIATFTVMICGLWLAEQIGLARWFFPFSSVEVIKLSSMMILCHAVLNLGNPTIALCQFKRRIQPFIIATLAAVAVSWICQFLLSRVWPEAALMVGLVLFAVIISASSYLVLGLHRKTIS